MSPHSRPQDLHTCKNKVIGKPLKGFGLERNSSRTKIIKAQGNHLENCLTGTMAMIVELTKMYVDYSTEYEDFEIIHSND